MSFPFWMHRYPDIFCGHSSHERLYSEYVRTSTKPEGTKIKYIINKASYRQRQRGVVVSKTQTRQSSTSVSSPRAHPGAQAHVFASLLCAARCMRPARNSNPQNCALHLHPRTYCIAGRDTRSCNWVLQPRTHPLHIPITMSAFSSAQASARK
jgi:hypothetical protein